MNSRAYSSEGLVLALRNFNESDRIVVVFSKKMGKISLVAKGVRKVGSRKSGHLSLFNHVNFQVSPTHGLGMITEVQSIEDFSEVKESLRKMSLAYYVSEIVGRITHEGEPNVKLFDLLKNTMDKLKNAKKLKELRFNFIKEILVLLGYWPEGQNLVNPDEVLAEVIERQVFSERVGRRISQ